MNIASQQASYTPSWRKYRFSVIGDSYTHHTGNINGTEFYTTLLEAQLIAQGCLIEGYNFGIGGNTTGQMLARCACMLLKGVPSFAIIYGGANDKNYATTVQAATANTVTVGSGLGVNYIAGTNILVGTDSRVIQSVAGDVVTVTQNFTSTPANGTAVTIDTTANIVAIGNYLKAGGCQNLLVCGWHYINWGSNVDTVSAQNPAYSAIRILQQAAATALGAIYVDLYAFMAALIGTTETFSYVDPTTGVVSPHTFVNTQGSGSWHIGASGNQHPNQYGEDIIRRAIYAAIPPSWLSALKS